MFRFSACTFLILHVIFGRAFNYFTDIAGFDIWMSVGAFIAWSFLGLIYRRAHAHTSLLYIISFALLVLSFAIQFAALESATAPLSMLCHLLVVVSSTIFGLGYSIYLYLWIHVFERCRPTMVPVYISVGSAFGLCISDWSLLLFGAFDWALIVCFLIRFILLMVSLLCLWKEMKVITSDLGNSDRISRIHERRQMLTYIGPVAFIFILTNFITCSSEIRAGELASTGVWLLPLITLVSAVIIVLVCRRFSESSGFLDILYDTLTLIAAILFLLYVSVTGGLMDNLWLVVMLANPLLNLAIIGKSSSMLQRLGLQPGRIVCGVFAAKELASITGFLLHASVAQQILNMLSIAFLVLFLIVFVVLFMKSMIRTYQGDDAPTESIRAYASSLALEYGCTPREEEILFYLLQGSSYARIARKLTVSDSTVKSHANHIYAKLGIDGRDALIDRYYARNDGTSASRNDA